MQRLWSFLGRKRNRDVLAWIGSGLAVVAIGLWAVFTYAFPAGRPSAGATGTSSVSANCGSIAVGGNVTGSQVQASSASDCRPRKPD
jgi:hypothetical protein